MRDLFNQDMDEIVINKPIRLIELFGGYGSQFMAMKRIGAKVESWLLCEFDPYAVKSFNAIHGTNYKPSDVCELHGKDLKIVEKDKYCYMLTYSFPCFTGDTLILTDKGLKQIKDVCTGDLVLTHTNKYEEVLAARKTGTKNIFKIKGMGTVTVNYTNSLGTRLWLMLCARCSGS